MDFDQPGIELTVGYDVSAEELCESLTAVMRGKKNDKMEVLCCQGRPSLGLKCTSITVDGRDSANCMS
jgi:hypothetical protein